MVKVKVKHSTNSTRVKFSKCLMLNALENQKSFSGDEVP